MVRREVSCVDVVLEQLRCNLVFCHEYPTTQACVTATLRLRSGQAGGVRSLEDKAAISERIAAKARAEAATSVCWLDRVGGVIGETACHTLGE